MIMSSGTSPKQRIFGVAWGCLQVANFYEKALFVKPTWRLRCVVDATIPCPSRYASIRTLSGSSLWWLGALWDPSFRAKGAAIFLAVSPPHRGSTKFATCAVALLDPKRVRARSAVAIRHFKVA